MATSTRGGTAAIAEFVSGLKVTDIPNEVFEAATDLAINVVGTTIGGAAQPTTQIVASLAREMGGTPESSVAGGGFRTSAAMAAYVNGTAAYTFAMDDTYWQAAHHPSVSALPAVLALAEARGASGRDAMAAYIAGLEVTCKLGSVVGVHHIKKGFHPPGTLGTFGALAGCAWLLGLNAEQITHALGIAVSLTSGIIQNLGWMVAPLHAGNAAKNGLLACLLASKGFLADPEGIEGKFGYVRTFNYGAPIEPWESLTEHLGDPWVVLKPGLIIKNGPCIAAGGCGGHGAITLAREFDFAPQDVERIDFGTNAASIITSKYPVPRLTHQAKYSSPYIVAVALLDGVLGPEQFFDERVTQPDVQEMVKRVHVYVHDELKEIDPAHLSRSHIRIALRDGRVYERWFDEAKGAPGSPLAREELCARFCACAKFGLSDPDLPRAYDAVAHLTELRTVDPLMAYIRGSRTSGEEGYG